MSLLIVVAETFEFQDGTLHFAPAVPFAVAEKAHLKQGDQLELRRPDGTSVRTRLHCFDFLVPSREKIGLCVKQAPYQGGHSGRYRSLEGRKQRTVVGVIA